LGVSNGAGSVPDGLVIGVFAGSHGLRGEAKLRPLTEFPERIARLKELRLRWPNGTEERRRVRGVRYHQQMALVLLEGVTTPEAAKELRGVAAVIDLEDAAPLPEGRYYEHQLIGLRVLTPEGEELGRVTEVIPGLANDVYVAGPYLIPATRDAVVRLDPEEGVLVVRSRDFLVGEEVR
jgi:16S rRNA processing protein RimM